MKLEILDLLKKIPFHPTGFFVLMLAGLIRIIYDGNSKFRLIVRSFILLLLLGTLISIFSQVFELGLKTVVILMACFGYLFGFILNALKNVGKRFEEHSPDWFETIVEGVLRRKLDSIEHKKKINKEKED